jgi:hypothetical protein
MPRRLDEGFASRFQKYLQTTDDRLHASTFCTDVKEADEDSGFGAGDNDLRPMHLYTRGRAAKQQVTEGDSARCTRSAGRGKK